MATDCANQLTEQTVFAGRARQSLVDGERNLDGVLGRAMANTQKKMRQRTWPYDGRHAAEDGTAHLAV